MGSVVKLKEVEKLAEEATKHKYYCKCGHTVVIYPFENIDKKLCKWCNHYVFTTKKAEFEYRTKTALLRKKEI